MSDAPPSHSLPELYPDRCKVAARDVAGARSNARAKGRASAVFVKVRSAVPARLATNATPNRMCSACDHDCKPPRLELSEALATRMYAGSVEISNITPRSTTFTNTRTRSHRMKSTMMTSLEVTSTRASMNSLKRLKMQGKRSRRNSSQVPLLMLPSVVDTLPTILTTRHSFLYRLQKQAQLETRPIRLRHPQNQSISPQAQRSTPI